MEESGLSILLVAFFLGHDLSHKVLVSTTATESILINDQTISARVIGAGERGVLFVALDSKKLRFVRWETIKQIDSI